MKIDLPDITGKSSGQVLANERSRSSAVIKEMQHSLVEIEKNKSNFENQKFNLVPHINIKFKEFQHPLKLSIQAIMYENSTENIIKSIDSIVNAVEFCVNKKYVTNADLCFGDCSNISIFSLEYLEQYVKRKSININVKYCFFNENLGTSRGHNRLLPLSDGEAIILQNPDVIPAPDAYFEMLKGFHRGGVGMTEARQIPLEHPKEFNSNGETSWASGACSMIPRILMNQLNGYDEKTFFLYCDDVDLSWRVRLAGYKIIFQASAAVFHDKSLTPNGRCRPTSAESYYSAEAALLMAHKWSNRSRVEELFAIFTKSQDKNLNKAAQAYQDRIAKNNLPAPLDPEHQVSFFAKDGNYAIHRFEI